MTRLLSSLTLLLLVASSMPGYSQSPPPECRTEKFLQSVGYSGLYKIGPHSVRRVAKLGNEARCEFRPALAVCLVAFVQKLSAHEALWRPSTQSDARARDDLIDTWGREIALLELPVWNFTVVSGTFFGATFKDVEASPVSLLAALPFVRDKDEPLVSKLLEPSFIDKATEFCRLGSAPDTYFSGWIANEINKRSTQFEAEQKKRDEEQARIQAERIAMQESSFRARCEAERARRTALTPSARQRDNAFRSLDDRFYQACKGRGIEIP